jgi:hypothetical protein
MKLLTALVMLALVLPRASAGDLIAFVGTQLALEPVTASNNCPEGHVCVPMDAYFRARYKVEQMVYGENKATELEFAVGDHYGRPMFSLYKHVMLFLRPTEHGLFHYKYQFQTMLETTTGEFVHCTAPPRLAGSRINVQLKGIDEDDYVWEASATNKAVMEDRNKRIFRIDTRFFCARAETSDEVLARYARDYFKPQGIDLHL